jgi:hypothetical protein
MSIAPTPHNIGHKRDLGAEDEGQPRGLQCGLVGFGDYACLSGDGDVVQERKTGPLGCGLPLSLDVVGVALRIAGRAHRGNFFH